MITNEWSDSNIRIYNIDIRTLSPVKWMKFPGGEINVKIPESHIESFKLQVFPEAEYEIEAVIKSSDDIMALLLTVDALKRTKSNIQITSLTIPYFPYARQDRVCNEGEALSVKVMADLINTINAKRVIIFDPHSDVLAPLINNVYVISQLEFISRIPNLSEYVLVSPDSGAEKKVYDLVQKLNVKGMMRLNKRRDLQTGEIKFTEVADYGVMNTDKLLIVDDICDGGRTFIEAVKAIRKEFGYTLIVDLYVTHGIFSKGFSNLAGYINHVWYTNSLRQESGPFWTLHDVQLPRISYGEN